MSERVRIGAGQRCGARPAVTGKRVARERTNSGPVRCVVRALCYERLCGRTVVDREAGGVAMNVNTPGHVSIPIEDELVQVVAVGMATLLDSYQGHTRITSDSLVIEDLVRRERFRQEEKWGEQHHSDLGWSIILLEEVCEYLSEVWSERIDALADGYELADDETRRGLRLISDVAVFEGAAREWCESVLGGGS